MAYVFDSKDGSSVYGIVFDIHKPNEPNPLPHNYLINIHTYGTGIASCMIVEKPNYRDWLKNSITNKNTGYIHYGDQTNPYYFFNDTPLAWHKYHKGIMY